MQEKTFVENYKSIMSYQQQLSPIQVYVIPCRWCNHYVFPKIVGTKIEYPNACPNRKCRRTTWNKSDAEIKKIREYKTSCLKYQKGVRRKVTEKVIAESFVCYSCGIPYNDADSLNRHNLRRHKN